MPLLVFEREKGVSRGEILDGILYKALNTFNNKQSRYIS